MITQKKYIYNNFMLSAVVYSRMNVVRFNRKLYFERNKS